MHIIDFFRPTLVLLALATHGSAAPFDKAGKKLWMSTPEHTIPPAGVPTSYPLNPSRRAQPPSGVHLPSPKDHPYPNEQDGHADFIRKPDQHPRAPGFQERAPVIKGVRSALDPNAQSPLNEGNPLAFKSKGHPYIPNTQLFDSSAIKTPLPTNRWWLNLMIEHGTDPIHPYPYVVRCLTNSSTVGMPKFTAEAEHVTSTQPSDWTISDAQNRLTQRRVTQTDALGVEVTWTGSGNAQMQSRFYKGMAFQTFEMQSMVPQLSTIHAILKVEKLGRTVLSARENVAEVTQDVANMPAVTKLTLNDGSQWLVAAKPAIDWTQTSTGKLQGNYTFSGFVQLAHLGDKPDSNINVLQRYVGTYPTEGAVTYAQVQTSDGTERAANIVFFYKTNTAANGDSNTIYNAQSVSPTVQLLTFALPHQMDLMNSTSVVSGGLSGYRSSKGPLTAIAGNIISYKQPLQQVGFAGPRALGSNEKAQIQRQLLKDAATSTNITAEDPYFFGKGVAKVARLLQIAQEVEDSASAASLSARLVSLLKPWLVSQTNSDPLVYDKTWGGIVSTLGLSDPSMDFGQGRYNDHHFHYGYFLYAGAVLASYDISLFAPFREPLNQLLRDYANPSYVDSQFPFMRHFDPYDGHSWAAGLFTFADGRNQESSGEAINAYYSAYLYAKALGFQDVASFYEIILNMEAHSGRRYWHPMRAQSEELYGKPFIHNTVGIVWASKVDHVTFFGANDEYVYGIQMLPFTPATSLLLTPDWVREAWSPGSSSGGMKAAAQAAGTNGWAQFLYSAYGMVDRNTALDKALTCTPDDGNTNTNVLHWILTNEQLTVAA
ncbi:hypothetical protein LPJ55_003701 [Coemansia sp. RSA 990]|nr:hypothetical protein LPJ55_003701 [Coemansia sp. RSA 990]